jgi:hypothetical protein
MFVGIDQGRRRDRTLDRRIEPDAPLASKVRIRAEAGRDGEFVDDDAAGRAALPQAT